MEQYIPKSVVLAEIERLITPECGYSMNKLIEYIDTLETKEVDLKEEVERFAKECGYKSAATIDFQFAEHFFELGLSVSNSTKVTTPNIDDVLKENGVNPDSKEAKIIKESYFMAIEKLTQKGEEV